MTKYFSNQAWLLMLKARGSSVEIQSIKNFFYDSAWEGITISQTSEEHGICMQEVNLYWIFMKERMPTM